MKKKVDYTDSLDIRVSKLARTGEHDRYQTAVFHGNGQMLTGGMWADEDWKRGLYHCLMDLAHKVKNGEYPPDPNREDRF